MRRAFAIATVHQDAGLLPHFLSHYERIGMAGIFLCVNVRGSAADLLERVRGHIAGRRAEIVDVCDEEFDTAARTVREFQVRRNVINRDDWCGFFDLDDFCQFPLPLDQMLATLERSGADFVSARYVDRVAADGTLAPLTDENLWLQYPLGCELTRVVLRAVDQKVILSSSDCRVDPGHHLPIGTGCRPLRAFSTWGWTHHFKWNERVLPRLCERAEAFRRRGKDWWVESQRFLDHYAKHGRIDLSNPALRVRYLGDFDYANPAGGESLSPATQRRSSRITAGIRVQGVSSANGSRSSSTIASNAHPLAAVPPPDATIATGAMNP